MAKARPKHLANLIFLLILIFLLPTLISPEPVLHQHQHHPNNIPSRHILQVQQKNTTINATRPDVDCNGILLSYNLDNMTRIRPFTSDNKSQPFGFGATASLQNSYTVTLRNYTLVIAFAHREILVSIVGGVLTENYPLPYNTTQSPFVSFSGYPSPDLPTPIATGGDLTKVVVNISLTGTLFGSIHPLPTNLTLADPSWDCSNNTYYYGSKFENFTSTCCVPNPNHLPKDDTLSLDEIYNPLIDPATDYQPRYTGNITISYDVMLTYPGSYLAQVTLTNKDELTRLDQWKLSWKWRRNEFIYSIKGAYTSETGSSECLFGPQGKYYQQMDFTNVTNCQRKPTVLDLPPWRYNDSDIGRIPFCCRNGTIFPKKVNASAYKSAFQMLVFKMPPDLDRFRLYSPDNFTLTSASPLSHEYKCSEPVRVTPSDFSDPSGLSQNTTSVASWHVTCNITSVITPKCCVSFSAYYNESIMPCRTCACGCPARIEGPPCSTTAPSVLIPPESLLQRYDNRTLKQLQWAEKNHLALPNPLPCGDYCGLNINWHILNQTTKEDYFNARMTMMNWENISYSDWYVTVKMNPAFVSYSRSVGMNTSTVDVDETLILTASNINMSYLIGVSNDSHPGMQQGVIVFKKLMNMNLQSGDGNPVKVSFNGMECSMPDGILTDTSTSRGQKTTAHSILGLVLVIIVINLLTIGL
jgi:COBRA-like protein